MLTSARAQRFLQGVQGHPLGGLFVLAMTTAARQGELLGLTWDRVAFEGAEIEISQALQKVDAEFKLVEPNTKSSRRRIALTTIGVDALRRHRRLQAEQAMLVRPVWHNPLNLVFTSSVGTPLDKTNLTKRMFKPLLGQCGLPSSLRFHDLRHIGASLMLGQGVPVPVVSEMLGHSDITTTMRVYAHAIPGAQRQAADAMDAALAS